MQYRKMDLVLFDYENKNKDGDETFRVFVQASPEITQPVGNAEKVIIGKTLRQRLRLLEERLLVEDEIIELGTELGKMLFPGTMASYVDDNLKEMEAGTTLRIQLRISDFPLADMPWEYAYLPNPGMPPALNFLALNKRVSVVRYDTHGVKQAKSSKTLNPINKDARPSLIMLMADPNKPPEYPELRLEDERVKIEEALRSIENSLTPKFHSNVTIETLLDAVAGDMHVFHFAGHGKFEKDLGQNFRGMAGEGSLVIFDEDKSTPRLLSVGDLVMALNGTKVRLAVLGACETGRRDGESAWTGIAAALSLADIPAVVSMQYTINNQNAIYFSRAFYKSLAEHESVDAAVTAGRHAIYMRRSGDKKERDWGVPVLYLRADDSMAVIFPRMPDVSPTGNYQPDPMRSDPVGALSGYHSGTGDGNIQSTTPYTSRKCPNCGTENPAIAKFCMECQTRIS
ncbi:MAG: CHAT domain-containing protein [Acidobacteriota bacterium]